MGSKDPSAKNVRIHKKRRCFLQTLGAAGLAGAAGCLGGDDDPDDADDDADDDGDSGAEAVFQVSGFEPVDTNVDQDETFDVSATITNTGDGDGSQDVAYRVDEDDIETENLSLDAFSDETVSFSVNASDLESGEHTHGIYTDDDEATGTLTVEAPPELDDPLLSFDGDVVTSGTGVLTGSLSNPYDFTVLDGEVSLSIPDNWEVTDESGTSFEELDAGDSQAVEWELAVPDTDGEYDLTATITYADGDRESGELEVSHTVQVLEAVSLPFGLNAGGISSAQEELEPDGVFEYDGVEFHPYNEEIEPPEQVSLISTHNSSGASGEGFEIEGTDADELYQTMMWSQGDFGYEILVPGGTYDVTFHLSEIWFGEEAGSGSEPDEDSQRTISGYVQGEPAFEEFAVWEEPLQASSFTAEGVEVQGEPMVIEVESSVENPMVNAIEIREAGEYVPENPVSLPYGLNAGGPSHDSGETVEYDGVEFEPYTDEIGPHPGVTLVGEHNTSGASGEGFEIEGTDADEIYQSMMFGEDFGYEIEVYPGTYEVTLHLAEIWWGENAGSGSEPEEDDERIYSAWVQGEPVFEELHLWGEVGELTAYPVTVEVEVEGGPLVIESETHSDNSMFNGIEIRGIDVDEPPAGEQFYWSAADYDVDDEPADSWEPQMHVNGYEIAEDDDGKHLSLDGPDNERTQLRSTEAPESTDTEIWARLKSNDPEDGDYHVYVRGEIDDDDDNTHLARFDDHALSNQFRLAEFNDGGWNGYDDTGGERFDIDHGEVYQLRGRVEGDEIKARWWQDGEDEPDEWHLEEEVDIDGPGYAGIGHWTGADFQVYELGVGVDGESAPSE